MDLGKYVKENETNGRNVLIRLNEQYKIFKEITFTEDRYNNIDAEAVSYKGNKIAIEIKTRTFPMTKYESVFVDKLKFDYLIDLHNTTGIYPLLIYVFSDESIMIYDLTKWVETKPRLIERRIKDYAHVYVDKEDRMLYEINYDDVLLACVNNGDKFSIYKK